MDWEKLDDIIVKDKGYNFIKRHEKVLRILEGLLVIGLLFGIIMFTLQDRDIKEQIRDNCGYTTDRYECICEPNLVEGWRELKEKGYVTLNLTNFENSTKT
jgi:hypothetical protein